MPRIIKFPQIQFKNGIGMFIPQIERLVFNYCETSGSSRGLIKFFKENMATFAAEHPYAEIVVCPRPGQHPLVKGRFLNGQQKVLCVKNMEPDEIKDHIRLLTDAADAISRVPPKGGVLSTTPAVRGIWSPFK